MSDENVRYKPRRSSLPDSEFKEFSNRIQEIKIRVITEAGRLDFLEADAKISLSHIQLEKAQNEKLAVQVKQLETKIDMFIQGNKEEGH
jgi:hypothetical protein